MDTGNVIAAYYWQPGFPPCVLAEPQPARHLCFHRLVHPAAAPSSAAEEAAAVFVQCLPAADADAAVAQLAIAALSLLYSCLGAASAFEGLAPSLAAHPLHGCNITGWGPAR